MNEFDYGQELKTSPEPVFELTNRIHSTLDKIESRANLILRPMAQEVGVMDSMKDSITPSTPIENELRAVLNHAQAILNRM